MASALTLLPLGALVLLLTAAVVGARAPGRRSPPALAWARWATLGTLLMALLTAVGVGWWGAATSPLVGLQGLGLALRLDALSATLFVLVAFIGAIVAQYSRHYLDGDARQGAFMGDLCLTLAAVTGLVLAGNLLQLVLAWIATSLALHRLLVFYGDRPRAVVAAGKKYWVARLSDVCLAVAAGLIYSAFDTAAIGDLLHLARTTGTPLGHEGTLAAATVLLVLAALLKSAQFPTHGWLTEVMETPTPVSALLHAGIVNAGGFLVLRLADVMVLHMASLHLLALIGGFTALFGSVVMLTQTSIKVSLAYSTVAQMGFMLLQCGLGAFSAAALHIVAHSLYKAHGFLSSGSVIELKRAAWVPQASRNGITPGRALVALALAVGVFVGTGVALGASVATKPAIVALGAILVMGLGYFLTQALTGRPSPYVLGRTLGAAGGIAVVYFTLQSAAQALFAEALPPVVDLDTPGILIVALSVVSFAALTGLQIIAPHRTGSRLWQRAYVVLAQGLYANVLFDRLVGALRSPRAAKP